MLPKHYDGGVRRMLELAILYFFGVSLLSQQPWLRRTRNLTRQPQPAGLSHIRELENSMPLMLCQTG
jgi:hypothetical protein